MLQIRWIFFCFVLGFIGEPLVKYLPVHHCPKHTATYIVLFLVFSVYLLRPLYQESFHPANVFTSLRLGLLLFQAASPDHKGQIQ